MPAVRDGGWLRGRIVELLLGHGGLGCGWLLGWFCFWFWGWFDDGLCGASTGVAETLELLDGAAVEPLGLRLIAEEPLPVGRLVDVDETGGHPETPLLSVGCRRFGPVRVVEEARHARNLESFLQAVADEAAFHAVGAEQGMARESDALDGEELLGICGLVEVDEAGFDLRDGVDIFVADGGESGRVEGIAAIVGFGGFADHDFVYCFTMRGRRGWDEDRIGVGNKGNIGERFLNRVGSNLAGTPLAECLVEC